MDDKIIATFCLCDDLLKAMHHQEDRQCQMNDAEIMTTAFVASLFFRGHHESARAMLQQHGYIPHMLSKPTVSLGVTCAVVYTYGCDDGRISPTRCAIIAAVLDGRWRPRRACSTPPAAVRSARHALAAG